MNRLIIIGNGFDIAHKLPTKYSDFLSQLSNKHSGFYNYICQYIPEDALWSSFEEALGCLDDEQLKDDNLCYLLGYGDENWRDSAHHDFQYMIGESLSFSKDLPIYFREWIREINTCARPVFSKDIIEPNSLFLSFNYTDTLEKIYNIPEDRIIYIHGKAKRCDNLIVGHHDEMLFQKKTEPKFQSKEEYELYYENCAEDVRVTEAESIIRNYFEETYKDTCSIIQQNEQFFSTLSSINEIYIFGHSLSYIDFDYFHQISQNVTSNCKWNISYFSDEDYCNAQQLVNNLGLSFYEFFKL